MLQPLKELAEHSGYELDIILDKENQVDMEALKILHLEGRLANLEATTEDQAYKMHFPAFDQVAKGFDLFLLVDHWDKNWDSFDDD